MSGFSAALFCALFCRVPRTCARAYVRAHTNDISVLYIIILYYIDSIKPTIKDKTRQETRKEAKQSKAKQKEKKTKTHKGQKIEMPKTKAQRQRTKKEMPNTKTKNKTAQKRIIKASRRGACKLLAYILQQTDKYAMQPNDRYICRRVRLQRWQTRRAPQITVLSACFATMAK